MSQNKRCFALKVPGCCQFSIYTRWFCPVDACPPRWWVVFWVVTGTLTYCWALCRNAPFVGTPSPPPKDRQAEQGRSRHGATAVEWAQEVRSQRRPSGLHTTLSSAPPPGDAAAGGWGDLALVGGGGGVADSPRKLGRGGGKRAQLTGPLISYYERWRQRRRKPL